MGAKRMQARVVETGGVELHLEALGRDGPGVGGAGNDVGAVIDGLIGRGSGQVGHGEMAADAGGFVRGVGECGLAGENGRLRVLRYGDGAEGEQCAGKDEKAIRRQRLSGFWCSIVMQPLRGFIEKMRAENGDAR